MNASPFRPQPSAFGLGRLRTDSVFAPADSAPGLAARVWARACTDALAPAQAWVPPARLQAARAQVTSAWAQLRPPAAGAPPLAPASRREAHIAALENLGTGAVVWVWWAVQSGILVLTVGVIWAVLHGVAVGVAHGARLVFGGG